MNTSNVSTNAPWTLSLWAMVVLAVSATAETRRDRYFAHATVEDAHGVIAPWYQGLNGQCDWRVRVAAETMKRFPWSGSKALADLPEYMINGQWHISDEGVITSPQPVRPTIGPWPMDPDYGYRFYYTLMGWVDYYRYTGDAAALAHMKMQADHCLDFTLTAADYEPWPLFPISVPFKGNAFGHADPNWIQLDISAHQGLALLRAYQMVGERRWLEAARHWGDLFARNCNFESGQRPWNRFATVVPYIGDQGFGIPVRPGNPNHLTGSTAMIVEFLDELTRLGYPGVNGAIIKARDRGLIYLRETVLPAWTARDAWGRFFWDAEALWQHIGPTDSAARIFMAHRDVFPHWRTDTRNVMSLYLNNATVVNGDTFSGAWAYPESSVCCGDSLDYSPLEMAAAYAQLGAMTDDEWARELARRQMLLATYHAEENGIVRDAISGGQIVAADWFKIVHPMPLNLILQTISWLPDLLGANRENHIVRSSAVVNSVRYGDGKIEYTTFDALSNTVDVLRLAFLPRAVYADDLPLPLSSTLSANAYTVQALANGDCILRVRHDGARRVRVQGDDPQEMTDDAGLTFAGSWRSDRSAQDAEGGVHVSSQENASASFSFSGNQLRLIGRVAPDGGQADIFLDGAKSRVGLDAWNPQPRHQQVLFYKNGLNDGPHELKVVVRGERNSRSTGTAVYLDAVQCSAASGSSGFGEGGGPTNVQRMIFGYPKREYTDSEGHRWLPATEWVTRGETGWLKDSAKEHWWQQPLTEVITGTDDPELYRYGAHANELWANITVGPGSYYVRLKLAERRSLPPDPILHAMTIRINGQTMVDDLDVVGTAGGRARAVDLVFNDIQPRRGIIEVRLANSFIGEAAVQALEIGPGSGGTGAVPVSVAAPTNVWKFADAERERLLHPESDGLGLRYRGGAWVELGDLKLRAPATFAAWIYPRLLGGDQRLLGQLDGPVAQGGALRLNGAQLEVWDAAHWQVLIQSRPLLEADARETEPREISGEGLVTGSWQHLAVVFQLDGTATAYLNGLPANTVRSGFDYAGVAAGLAAPFHGSYGRTFLGRMDDCRILPRALSPQEIIQLTVGE